MEQKVHFEVMVTPEKGGRSAFKETEVPSLHNLEQFQPPMDKNVEASRRLHRLAGVVVHHIGAFSISATTTLERFNKLFSTNIMRIKSDNSHSLPKDHHYYMREPGSKFVIPEQDGLDQLLDGAYIQDDPLFFANERPIPPQNAYNKWRIRVPVDVAQIMGASPVHRQGITGKGVTVAMPDTGFYHHPYFLAQGYNILSVPSPDTIEPENDTYGHGTGEAANLLATAPGINFIGVKMENPTLAFKTAMELKPHVITNSWGYSIDRPNTTMPNWLMPLYLTVLQAVKQGIVVVFSAGNGHYGFPGSMPEVISVGGVYVDENLVMMASDYTSCFDSTWFPGRQVPDFCGLCGMQPTADYIVLPVQAGAYLDNGGGWGAFSGTSAAAPMVAGICALLKEAKPELTPAEIKNLIKYTALDVLKGKCIHGRTAQPGVDGATGFGLANAKRVINAIL